MIDDEVGWVASATERAVLESTYGLTAGAPGVSERMLEPDRFPAALEATRAEEHRVVSQILKVVGVLPPLEVQVGALEVAKHPDVAELTRGSERWRGRLLEATFSRLLWRTFDAWEPSEDGRGRTLRVGYLFGDSLSALMRYLLSYGVEVSQKAIAEFFELFSRNRLGPREFSLLQLLDAISARWTSRQIEDELRSAMISMAQMLRTEAAHPRSARGLAERLDSGTVGDLVRRLDALSGTTTHPKEIEAPFGPPALAPEDSAKLRELIEKSNEYPRGSREYAEAQRNYLSFMKELMERARGLGTPSAERDALPAPSKARAKPVASKSAVKKLKPSKRTTAKPRTKRG